ncbi:MAG: hypothetical protein IPK78_13015 [Rhodospirillales bacterium]|nr:hypothetical protein [Rhodospirillales bacterium]
MGELELQLLHEMAAILPPRRDRPVLPTIGSTPQRDDKWAGPGWLLDQTFCQRFCDRVISFGSSVFAALQ